MIQDTPKFMEYAAYFAAIPESLPNSALFRDFARAVKALYPVLEAAEELPDTLTTTPLCEIAERMLRLETAIKAAREVIAK